MVGHPIVGYLDRFQIFTHINSTVLSVLMPIYLAAECIVSLGEIRRDEMNGSVTSGRVWSSQPCVVLLLFSARLLRVCLDICATSASTGS